MKKSISFILVMLMVLCMVPGAALAADNVAQIGTNGYESIQAAVDAAQDGDTIVVIKDHEIDCSSPTVLSGTIYKQINIEKNITIDLNGKAISAQTGDKDIVLINVQNGGQLVLDDTIGGGSVSVTANVETYALLCCLGEQSKLTVNNGTYKLNKGMEGQGLVYSGQNHAITINGGTFLLDNLGEEQNSSPWIFNAYSQNERHVNVNGGTFNADILHQYYPFEVSAPKEKALKKNDDGTWTMVDAVAYVNEQHKSGKWYTNEVGYATLEEAIAAAEKYAENNKKANVENILEERPGPNTVTLLDDCVVNDTLNVSEDMTIALNGKTIIWEGNDTDPIFTVKEGGLLTVNGAFTPQKANHIFQGWYTDKDYKTSYSFGDKAESTIDNTNGSEDISLYAKWNVDAPISSGYSGPDLWYIGGNTFGTTTNQVPTSVEIDNVPVSFTMNGNQITVGCIQPGSDWVTVRWGSVSNQRSFTPDANAYCTQTVIPKTGDMPIWAAIAEFLGF